MHELNQGLYFHELLHSRTWFCGTQEENKKEGECRKMLTQLADE